MCTTPNETCLRSFFLNVFFLPFFSGAAAPPAAAGFAINRPWSLVVGNHTSNKSSESQSFVVTKRCIAARALANDQRPKTNDAVTSSPSLFSSVLPFPYAVPCGYARWYAYAGRGRAGYDDDESRDRNRFR